MITPSDVNNAIFPTYIDGQKYIKGDRIFLKPTEEDEQTVPAGTRTNFMGKTITYSEPTTFTEYPFRIRAKINNPRDPRLPGVFGVDWAVDDPSATVEEGSNSNGSYTLYAGGAIKQIVQRTSALVNAGAETGFSTYPVHFATINNIATCKLSGTPSVAVQSAHESLTTLELTRVKYGTISLPGALTATFLVSAKVEGTI